MPGRPCVCAAFRLHLKQVGSSVDSSANRRRGNGLDKKQKSSLPARPLFVRAVVLYAARFIGSDLLCATMQSNIIGCGTAAGA